MPTRQFCRDLARASAMPIDVERVDVARACARGRRLDRAGGARRASRVLRSRRRAPGRDGRRRRAHERRSGRDVSAAAAARRGSARPGRHASAIGPRRAAVHRGVRAPMCARFSRTRQIAVPRGRVERRSGDSAQSHPPRAAPAARARVSRPASSTCSIAKRRSRAKTPSISTAPPHAAAARLVSSARRAAWSSTSTRLLASRRRFARRVIRLAQQIGRGAGTFVGFDAVEAVLRFAVSKSTGQLDLPGHRVNRRGGWLVLTRSRGPREAAPPGRRLQLSARGAGSGRGAGGGVCDFGRDGSVPTGRVGRRGLAAGRAQRRGRRRSRPAWRRRWRSGTGVRATAFRPAGSAAAARSCRTSSSMRKSTAASATITPVVVDSAGQIVWVAGHALAEEFRVTDPTRDVVILKRVPI